MLARDRDRARTHPRTPTPTQTTTTPTHTQTHAAPNAPHPQRLTLSRLSQQDPAYTLANWLLSAKASPDPSYLWQLLQSANYTALWDAARSAGEHLRAKALTQLYAARREPAGTHPDPRDPAPFSSSAILSRVALDLGLRWWAVPDALAREAEKLTPPTMRPMLCWLMKYPDGRPVDLAVRLVDHDLIPRLHFAVACLLGYFFREGPRITDPNAPSGMIVWPSDPILVPILHQFARALLCLPPVEELPCPPEHRCMCAQLRARYTMPPADHAEPTGPLDAETMLSRRRTPWGEGEGG